MKDTSTGVLIRIKLLMFRYEGPSQLPDIMRHIDDAITAIDGLYTQLALIAMGEIQGALEYEDAARSYLKEYYYTAIHAISNKQIADNDWSIHSYDHYPFATLTNPLLEYNRRTIGKYPVSIQPLTLSAISRGSINIDLLGIGKILDFIEHTVKQIRWEALHEKEMAIRSRQMASLEEQLLSQRIIEAHLTNEEKRLYIASKKIELFDLIRKLDLPLKQKRKLVRSVVEKVNLVDIMGDIKLIKRE
ncbi:MAG: hypothetical protein H7Y59_05910 [Anaerolineales bacterium]|nr:hypothetical protein [Anaerolineales bacterium]